MSVIFSQERGRNNSTNLTNVRLSKKSVGKIDDFGLQFFFKIHNGLIEFVFFLVGVSLTLEGDMKPSFSQMRFKIKKKKSQTDVV